MCLADLRGCRLLLLSCGQSTLDCDQHAGVLPYMESHPGSCNGDKLFICPPAGCLCLDCVADKASCTVGLNMERELCLLLLFVSFGQDEQNKQASLLKVFVAATN